MNHPKRNSLVITDNSIILNGLEVDHILGYEIRMREGVNQIDESLGCYSPESDVRGCVLTLHLDIAELSTDISIYKLSNDVDSNVSKCTQGSNTI